MLRRDVGECGRCTRARILQINPDGAIAQFTYDEAEPASLTRTFLTEPDRFLHHLFNDD